MRTMIILTMGIHNEQTYPTQMYSDADSVSVYHDWKAVAYQHANETL